MTSHGTAYQWSNQQVAELTSRMVRAVPQALQLMENEDGDPSRVLRFTTESERIECAIAAMLRMLLNGHADTVPRYWLPVRRNTSIPIWQGPLDGDGEMGSPNVDPCSATRDRVPFRDVIFLQLRPEMRLRSALEELSGMSGRYVRLDAAVAEALDTKRGHHLLGLLAPSDYTAIGFPGTVVIHQGKPALLFLVRPRSPARSWSLEARLLDASCGDGSAFAVLPR